MVLLLAGFQIEFTLFWTASTTERLQAEHRVMIDESITLSLRHHRNAPRTETVNFLSRKVGVRVSLQNITKIDKLPHAIARVASEGTTSICGKNRNMLHSGHKSRIPSFFAPMWNLLLLYLGGTPWLTPPRLCNRVLGYVSLTLKLCPRIKSVP